MVGSDNEKAYSDSEEDEEAVDKTTPDKQKEEKDAKVIPAVTMSLSKSNHNKRALNTD